MTPAALLKLVEEAAPGPGDVPPNSWTGLRAGKKAAAHARLIALAPDLARLVVAIGEALAEAEIALRNLEGCSGCDLCPDCLHQAHGAVADIGHFEDCETPEIIGKVTAALTALEKLREPNA